MKATDRSRVFSSQRTGWVVGHGGAIERADDHACHAGGSQGDPEGEFFVRKRGQPICEQSEDKSVGFGVDAHSEFA